MVKEHPILFSTDMVKAILDGRKTMTRRVVKLTEFQKSDSKGYDWSFRNKRMVWNDITNEQLLERCPYGGVGSRLWVRETFCYKYDPITSQLIEGEYWYAATNPEVEKMDGDGFPEFRKNGEQSSPWLPSIHMPRVASRITLEITNIKVERVQDISVSDVVAEGVLYPVSLEGKPLLRLTGRFPPCEYLPPGLLKDLKLTEEQWITAHFASLWDEINFKRGYSWESNPWV